MRRALPASLLLHIGALGSAYLLFVGARPLDQAGMESMTVEFIPVVATTNVTADQADLDSTTAQVSAGADEVVVAEAEPIEMLEPVEADAPVLRQLDGIDAETPEEPATAEPPAQTEPVEAEPADRIDVAAIATPATPLRPAEAVPPAIEPAVEPAAQVMTADAPLEAQLELALTEPMAGIDVPEVTDDIELPPVPRPKTVTQTSQPTYADDEAPTKESPSKKPKAADKAADKKAADKPAPKKVKVANVGNGGANQADANAGKASGGKGKKAEPGNAEKSTYEGLVRRHLGRKAKMGKVGKGTVLVSFVIGKGGNVKSVSVARSSGNAKLDSAAIANVKRAAPYPPIPDELGKASWSFNIPMDGDR